MANIIPFTYEGLKAVATAVEGNLAKATLTSSGSVIYNTAGQALTVVTGGAGSGGVVGPHLVTTATAEATTVTATGLAVAVPWGVAAGAALAALGIGIGIGFEEYNSDQAFWNDVGANIYGATHFVGDLFGEDHADVLAYSDGKNLYLPEDIIDAVRQSILANDAYNLYQKVNFQIGQPLPTPVQDPMVTLQLLIQAAENHRAGDQEGILNAGDGAFMRAVTLYFEHFANTYGANYCHELRLESNKWGVAPYTYAPNLTIVSYPIEGATVVGVNEYADYNNSQFQYDEAVTRYRAQIWWSGQIDGETELQTLAGAIITGVQLAYQQITPVFTGGNIFDYTLTPGSYYRTGNTEVTEGQSLEETFPDWYLRGIEIPKPGPNEDPYTGIITTTPYLPINIPSTDPLKDPVPKEDAVPQGDAQKGTQPDPDSVPDPDGLPLIDGLPLWLPPIIQKLIDDGGDLPTDPDPTDTGEDPTLPVLPNMKTCSGGLLSVYNPSLAQIKGFGQWLWSANFLQMLETSLFNDPMDAIIGLQIIYATPQSAGSGHIKCGYLECDTVSGVPYVTNQFVEIDCGSINVGETFGNACDYAPYTRCSMYLPFVSFVDLDTNEVINSRISLKYRVDVFTGECLAMIKIKRDGMDAVLYQYAGNCAMQIPLTGANRSGILSSLVSVIGGAVSGGIAGAALAAGAAALSGRMAANISRSGQFGANAGALGGRKPYLIIQRPVQYTEFNWNVYRGIPANKTVTLGSCSGFTRVRDIRLDSLPLTDEEKEELMSILEGGIIIG